MLKSKLETIKSGPDENPNYVYVNMSIINNQTEDVDENNYPLCKLKESSDSSIIEDSGSYDLGVVKFTT